MVSNLYFNLRKAEIKKALFWNKTPIFILARIFKKIIPLFFILSLLLFLYGFLSMSFPKTSNSFLLALILIEIGFFVISWLLIYFLESKLKNPKINFTIDEFLKNQSDFNIAELLNFDAARIITKTLKSKKPNSTILFLNIISEKSELVNFVFSRLLLDYKGIAKQLKNQSLEDINSPLVTDVLLSSAKIALNRAHKRIWLDDILTALSNDDPVFQRLLIDNNLKSEDVRNLAWWYKGLKEKQSGRKRWWDYENLIKKGTLAKEWSAGFTINLDRYSVDWTEMAKMQKFPDIIGHVSQIDQTERILARHEYNNVLLVGEPGVGRKSVVQGILRKSVFGQSLPSVNYKRVVELNMSVLLSDISDPEEVEVMLDKIFQEVVMAGNIILVIDEFQNFIGVKPGPGTIDISGVISSYLHLPQFQVVAITSYEGLHKNIEMNSSVNNLFEKVEVQEPTKKETMVILENFSLQLEARYGIFVSYPALRETFEMCQRFLSSLPFPKKALDLLDETIIYVKRSTKDKIVLPSHVAKIISQKTQIPVGEMESKEKEILLNLENLIHQRIINQSEAVREVSTALRRARSEISIKIAPMGTFLFLGPTGVGKTETSKALAEIYFGSESKMIRLDMSEFQNTTDVSRLIGSAGVEGMLTTAVKENPFSLVLLDEIEKAHPNILNLFLQVLDEGFLTDGVGRKIDFKNTIIIATSNAGYQLILQAIKENLNWEDLRQKMLDYLFEKGTFRPEFINRFDATVIFKPLTQENLMDISALMLGKIQRGLKSKGMDLIITNELKRKIAELGYDPKFGARQMKRVVQDKVENELASALLSNRLTRGNRVEVNPDDFSLKISRI